MTTEKKGIKAMRNTMLVVLSLVLSVWGFSAQALNITDSELSGLSFSYTQDSPGFNDTAGDRTFETHGMGHAIANGFLYVVVQTNFPQAGAMGNDSYTSMTTFQTGDLYLNVGGTFQNGGGSVYGVATTSHANVVQQAYAGQIWTNVVAGSLYSNAVFATGTYEQYQSRILNREGQLPTPGDGDGNNRLNSYPTLIKTGSLVAGDVSGVRYRANTTDAWDYDIIYKISLAALNLTGNEQLQAFWVMECGNDGAQHLFGNPTIPEPTTVGLLMAGVAAFAAKRRRTV